MKLQLKDIRKNYLTGGTEVEVLKGICLQFRQNEFVSILGQSGCGKTTLLNIIGGLDRYNSGDLLLNGQTTKDFKVAEWDAYRNHSIGFVFQNYNLISHQTVLKNVEIALTLSGVSKDERRKKAKAALTSVGLQDHIDKKPNQLSGGQMQRVAIARALVNDPDIILADEPTGALDSQTSVQVMDILRDIAKEKLVIMVTHNNELAEKYSTRIVKLFDGEIIEDSNPPNVAIDTSEEKKQRKLSLQKTAMSLSTALRLSFNNLLTKKGRTIITSFAGSIGIIGVALVLALSTGLSNYISKLQNDILSGMPLVISNGTVVNYTMGGPEDSNDDSEYEEYPESSTLYNHDPKGNSKEHKNAITEEFVSYINKIPEELPDVTNNIEFTSGITMNVLAKYADQVVPFPTDINMIYKNATMTGPEDEAEMNTFWQGLPSNDDFILSQYDLIGENSRLPENANEIVLVVDSYNRINKALLDRIGVSDSGDTYNAVDFIGKSFLKVVLNNEFYQEQDGLFTPVSNSQYGELFNNDNNIPLTITGVLREKPDTVSGYLSTGFAYTQALSDLIKGNAESSNIVKAARNSDINIVTGASFINAEEREQFLRGIGSTLLPSEIKIFPTDFSAKDKIKTYIDKFNNGREALKKLIYSDLSEFIVNATEKLISTITYVFVGFSSISLVVSSIMIGIITYVSVVERTKEIGILRSVGARKKDIARVFNAETLIIGFFSGAVGVLIAYLLQIPINIIVYDLTEVPNIASLTVPHAIFLILGSMALTYIAGLIPARGAAKKDPVVALRSE